MGAAPTKEAEPVPEAEAQAPLPLSRRQQGTFALSFSTATVVLLACAVLGYIVGPLLKTYYFADAPIRWVSILGYNATSATVLYSNGDTTAFYMHVFFMSLYGTSAALASISYMFLEDVFRLNACPVARTLFYGHVHLLMLFMQ